MTLVDQRGCGRSKPTADVEANTTPHLVEDIEKLRRRVLGDSAWACVIGGSWGSTLALAYAQAHPQSASSIVLRGVCAMREKEIRWLFSPRGGAAALNPTGWAAFARVAGNASLVQEDAVLKAYYDLLQSRDETARLEAKRSWQRWEMHASAVMERFPTRVYGRSFVSGRSREPKRVKPEPADPTASYLSLLDAGLKQNPWTNAGPQPLLTCHYSVHRGFLENDAAVLLEDNVDKIRHIPAIAVQVGSTVALR